jgi:predicted MFS family arabinose efflux permease
MRRWRRTTLGGPGVWRLSAGLLLSRTGDKLTTIALLWFVLDLTGSSVDVGLVLLCAGLPPVVTGPLLGRLLDRWSPRRVMVADNLLRAVLVGAIPVLHWLGRLDMPLVYALSLAAGALVPATDAGVRAVLPRLVDEADLEGANALLSIGDQLSALVGPAAGGLLVGLVGAPPVLLLDAVSFLAMAALVRPLPDSPSPPAPRLPVPGPPGRAAPHPSLRPRAATAAPRPAGRARAFRGVLGDPTVRTVFGVTLVYYLAYGPLEPALPLYSRDVLGGGAGGYGLLWSAFGAGALLGLASVPVVRRLPPGLALAGNAVAWGAALLPLLAVTSIAPAMLALAVGGLIWAPYVTIEATLLQRLVPPSLLGRAFGIRRAVAAAAAPLGAAAGGLLLRYASPTAVIGVSAVTCILAGGLALCVPALHRLPLRRTTEVPEAQPCPHPGGRGG